MRIRGIALGTLALAVMLCGPAAGDVTLPAVISDGMILQQAAKAPIWGKAQPGEQVTVALGDQKAVAAADKDGKWMVGIDVPKADGKPLEMTITGKNTVKLKDVLAGEVWLCSGQSNMSWPFSMGKVAQPGKGVELDLPHLRVFNGASAATDVPQWTTEGNWVASSQKTIGQWAATVFFFGRDLHNSLKAPVGLIDVSWGGHQIDHFMSDELLRSDPDFRGLISGWTRERYAQTQRRRHPSSIYNCKVAPVIPYGIRGAIWWQGEFNVGTGEALYEKLFAALIRDWRKTWGHGDFPFIFVQLQRDKGPQKQPVEKSGYAEVREAQLRTLALPKTAMVVIIDLEASLHPRSKDVVGNRLELAAEAIAYGKDVVHSGPIYDSMTVEGGKFRLKFKHVGGGLVAKGAASDTQPAETLKGFAIAGQDMKFVWAEARVEPSTPSTGSGQAGSGQVADTVLVWSKDVPKPAAVRYAWADNPDCNLFNKVGLPASPFRTDR